MTPSGRVQSVNERLRIASQSTGVPIGRLRRALAFQRLLVRLEPLGLVLKGGFCLELRLPMSARATKDLDLVGRFAQTHDEAVVIEALEPALDVHVHDGFGFAIDRVREIRPEGARWSAWRVGVDVTLDGHRFDRVLVDLVGQVSEVDGAVEPLTVPVPVPIPGFEAVTVLAVDVTQHAAEKLHALSRSYSGDRVSSRDKDLVDLVLLVESGLLTDTRRLWERLVVVYRERDDSAPPATLPAPPGDWAVPYAAKAADLHLGAVGLATAYDLVAGLLAAALTEGTHP